MEARSEEETRDLIYRIEEIQERLIDATGDLAEIARELDDEHALRYIIANLRCLISDDHGYLDRSYNIAEWLRDLEEPKEEEEGND